jgi:SAM-dependent methyltransferase
VIVEAANSAKGFTEDMASNRRRLAAYFGVAPEILAFVPELLADFTELGSEPELVARWLHEVALGSDHRVLDLGCGKGAVAIAVAKKLGCHVDGVDALAPFIDAARAAAETAGVANLCAFRHGDLRRELRRAGGYDALLYLAVGEVLGTLEESVRALRRAVRVGGYVIIDDGFRLEEAAVPFPGYELMETREEAFRALTASGDRVVKEWLTSREEVRAQNEGYFSRIGRRARELAVRHPQHAERLTEYVEKQRQENRVLETAVQSAVWLLQRAA